MPLRAKIHNATISTTAKMSQPQLPKEEPTDEANDVMFGSVYGARTIQLNRPKKLNSLNGSMIRKILPRLLEWEKSQLASVIVIAGAGDRAFCAGGDVAALAEYNKEGPEGQARSAAYFGLEYQLDHLIASYRKPYVAYMDGITMGGGVGLSVHAPFRIATERTVFAMPETTIGFFPDVGGSFFLPRLDGFIGRYLALTSERLQGANVLYAGIATHYVDSSSLSDLTGRLSELVFKDHSGFIAQNNLVNAAIEEFNSGIPYDQPMLLAGEMRKAIDRCFRYTTVEEILAALERETSTAGTDEWATKTMKTMKERSPTSLKVTLRAMVAGEQWRVDESFRNEYHIAAEFMRHPDFVEGVSARLIKPLRTPKWQPELLGDVSDNDVATFFKHQGKEALELYTERNYSDYPWKFGLPRERDIESFVNQSKTTKEMVLQHFLELTYGKVGVREKVEEVLTRMCNMKGGVLTWERGTNLVEKAAKI